MYGSALSHMLARAQAVMKLELEAMQIMALNSSRL